MMMVMRESSLIEEATLSSLSVLDPNMSRSYRNETTTIDNHHHHHNSNNSRNPRFNSAYSTETISNSVRLSSSSSSSASNELLNMSHTDGHGGNNHHHHHHHHHHNVNLSFGAIPAHAGSAASPSRYESQKRRDWNTFAHYLRNQLQQQSISAASENSMVSAAAAAAPGIADVSRCSGEHVVQFLRYLDQFGKTRVHLARCLYFGVSHPPGPCECPLRQAWGSLDALIGRLRAAFEENGGKPESNPFGAKHVRFYLREVRDSQAKARGIAYEKKKRKRPLGLHLHAPPSARQPAQPPAGMSSSTLHTSYGHFRSADPLLTPPPLHHASSAHADSTYASYEHYSSS